MSAYYSSDQIVDKYTKSLVDTLNDQLGDGDEDMVKESKKLEERLSEIQQQLIDEDRDELLYKLDVIWAMVHFNIDLLTRLILPHYASKEVRKEYIRIHNEYLQKAFEAEEKLIIRKERK